MTHAAFRHLLDQLPNKNIQSWMPTAFNDITVEIHRQTGNSPARKSTTRFFPSLKDPHTYWLAYQAESGAFMWSETTITLRSTQDATTMQITRNMVGLEKGRQVRVNNGAIHNLELKDRTWLLQDQKGSVLAAWHLGKEEDAIGDSEGPHYYDKVIAGGVILGELIVPGVFTSARFIHQPAAPLLRYVPENLSQEQSAILLSFLLLQVSQF